MALLEIACFTPDSAIAASDAGADRVELCDHAEVGGTTPPLAWLYAIRDKVTVPINVMIRPRGGDFVYSDEEFQGMKSAIEAFKAAGIADGFVFGILKHDRSVDVERTLDLVNLSAPLPCTFHRAFDETADLMDSLEKVIRCGIKTILTSGGCANAAEGHETLTQLVCKAKDRVTIMPGGGVRSTNMDMLKNKTNAVAYHSSALINSGAVANAQEIIHMKTILLQNID